MIHIIRENEPLFWSLFRKNNPGIRYEELIRDIILKQFEGELKEDLLWYGIENIDFKKGESREGFINAINMQSSCANGNCFLWR